LNLIDKERFELAWIVDFPMYEYNEEDRRSDSRQPVLDAAGRAGGAETQTR